MADLELRKVVKRFGAAQVIHGVDLRVGDGEFVVFVGPSGCGKSTLLRMIAGLEEISGGAVLIDGADVTEVPAAKRELAMVFQSYALYPHMSVKKNLSFGLETMGVARAEIERKIARRGGDPADRRASRPQAGAALGRAAAAGGDRAGDRARAAGSSSSTSRCRTSTPSSGRRCGWRSTSCTAGSG